MSVDYKTLFGKTPPTKLFLMAALPGIISMLASALYQLIDGVFVGRLLGETAFAAPPLAAFFSPDTYSAKHLHTYETYEKNKIRRQIRPARKLL